jgi:DNA-binding NarL/FixJ family response regulator
MQTYRIILADDHVIFRQGMKRLIEEEPGLEVIGEVNDGSELLERLNDLKPDLVILDISMPGTGGIEAAHEIRKRYPHLKVLVLTMHKKKEYLYHAISAGAQGYLVKEDSDIELFSAIETIRNGGVYVTHLLTGELAEDLSNLFKGNRKLFVESLSKREREVLKLIAEGKLNKEIADLLFISVRTVENHRANILRKLKLKKTAELVRYAIGHGIVELTF